MLRKFVRREAIVALGSFGATAPPSLTCAYSDGTQLLSLRETLPNGIGTTVRLDDTVPLC